MYDCYIQNIANVCKNVDKSSMSINRKMNTKSRMRTTQQQKASQPEESPSWPGASPEQHIRYLWVPSKWKIKPFFPHIMPSQGNQTRKRTYNILRCTYMKTNHRQRIIWHAKSQKGSKKIVWKEVGAFWEGEIYSAMSEMEKSGREQQWNLTQMSIWNHCF